ncbi:MAG: alpha/beta hydrolase [Alphaproteobacteria bacterium]|nr:alpha/beta hydrolase [Alphaproteobacteria bacterium]
MPTTSIKGAEIYFEVLGSGPPLVLITGQGSGPAGRAALIDGLAARHTVLTYDQRGTGRSEPVPQGHPIADLAEDAIALMDHVRFEAADVVGHSTGTGMATVIAAGFPTRVRSLVLAAPWTHADDHLHAIQELRKAAARTLSPDHYAHLNAVLLYPPEYRRENAARFAKIARDAIETPQDAAAIGARLDAILAFDARPRYPRIACPTLVLSARDDQVMPYWFAEDAAQAIHAAAHTPFDGGGHMFAETRTEDFLSAIDSFRAAPS